MQGLKKYCENCQEVKGIHNNCPNLTNPPMNKNSTTKDECCDCGHYLRYHQVVRFGDACTFGNCPCFKYVRDTKL